MSHAVPDLARDGCSSLTVNSNRADRATARKAGTAPACRATILRPPAEARMAITFKSVLQGRWFHLSGDDRHIKKWASDARTEETWNLICECARRAGRTIDAKDFIRFVLDERREATEYLTMRAAFDQAQKKAFAVQKKEISELLKSQRPPLQLAADIEAVITAMRTDYIELVKSPEPPSRQDKAGQAKKDKAGLRKKQVGWLRHKTFMRTLSDYLFTHCGRKLYHETGVLTEIAFPGHKFPAERVREALRPSTRGDRARKR